jgi:putative oxidoreductase
MQWLRRFEPQVFALLRIFAGLLFVCHGAQKLFGFPEPIKGMSGHLPPLLLAAAVIELAGGLMIVLGVFASFAAFIASGEMAVAYFMSHWQFGKASFWPLVNKGEMAVLYCFIFLYIAAHGPGIWSATKK